MQTRTLVGALLTTTTILGCKADPADLGVASASEEFILPRHPVIQGRDGGSSGLAFGRSVWAYGDTVLEAPDERGETWHTNSFGLADVSSWKTDVEEPLDSANVPAYFVPRTDEEIAWDDAHAAEECEESPCHSRWAIWPSEPLYDEDRDRAWILYGLHNADHKSGIGVALWDGPGTTPERIRVGDSWLLFPEPEPEYANAPLVYGGHLYAYGCVRGGLFQGFDRQCSVGRAPLDEVADRSAWRFFDGDKWVKDYKDAENLFDGQPIMSVGWNQFLDRFLMVYALPFGNEVRARTASHLEGPWSDEATLFEVPGESAYDAVHHSELAQEGGRVQYISYSRPIDRGWFGAEHVVWRIDLERKNNK